MMSLGRGRGGKLDEFCSTFIDPTSVATLLFFPCTEFEFIKGMSITKEFIIVLFGCEHKSIISLILVEVFSISKNFGSEIIVQFHFLPNLKANLIIMVPSWRANRDTHRSSGDVSNRNGDRWP